MRLGILSDTHDQIARLCLAVRLLRDEGADVLAHCGDLTGPHVVAVCAELPCYFTFGNHDADNVPVLERAVVEVKGVCLGWGGEVTLAGKRAAIRHGHMRTGTQRLTGWQPEYLPAC